MLSNHFLFSFSPVMIHFIYHIVFFLKNSLLGLFTLPASVDSVSYLILHHFIYMLPTTLFLLGTDNNVGTLLSGVVTSISVLFLFSFFFFPTVINSAFHLN